MVYHPGNQMRYQLTLPKDPSPSAPLSPGKSFNFELHPAFWFGMAMCDTQSFPELLPNCKPDSDSNIVDPAISAFHPGVAFMEMQFYPPGWAFFPQAGGISCDSTKWCAALNIDSLSQNPVTGQSLNPTCASTTGVEYVNFAFITKNGTPQPNSPPNPNADLFMNSGDKLAVTLHDTAPNPNPVQPSVLCLARFVLMDRTLLRHYPWLRTPPLPVAHAGIGNGPWTLAWVFRSLIRSDFVSHASEGNVAEAGFIARVAGRLPGFHTSKEGCVIIRPKMGQVVDSK